METEERKFLRLLKDRQEQDMKAFLSGQKKDYNQTKEMYKKVYEKSELNSSDRKRLLNERKAEIRSQQQAEEELQLEKLRKEAKRQMITFKQGLLEDLHKLQNELLQEELNLMQQQKDRLQQLRRTQTGTIVDLQNKHLRALQDMRYGSRAVGSYVGHVTCSVSCDCHVTCVECHVMVM